jgi:hypothetical protein
VVHCVTAQHEHGDVDDGEDAQEQQSRGPAERRYLAEERDEAEGEGRREQDRNPRRTPGRVDQTQDSGQHTLPAHAVQQAAGHQHVDQQQEESRPHHPAQARLFTGLVGLVRGGFDHEVLPRVRVDPGSLGSANWSTAVAQGSQR